MEKMWYLVSSFPGKFCCWREILEIVRGNLSFRWIFWSFSYTNFAFFSSLAKVVQDICLVIHRRNLQKCANLESACMDKMWNLISSFPGNFAFRGKSLQFWGKIYHLDGYSGLFLTQMSEICQIIHSFDEICDHIPGKCCTLSSIGMGVSITESLYRSWRQ